MQKTEPNTKTDALTKNAIPASSQAGLITVSVFLAYMGQMLLNPIIAPLSREMGLREWHIGATISLSAIVLALLSAFWGRTSQRIGVKRILMTGMLIATIALSAFTIISYLGMNRMLTGVGLVIGVMVTRGLLYGAGISAVAPTAQAHLVTNTPSESGRVKAVGMLGAAQGIAAIIGGIAGGALAAIGGLLLPLIAMPIVMIAGIIVLALRFRPQTLSHLIKEPKHISLFDPRIRPWLVGGLFMFLVFSSVQTIFGFTVQDRFHFSAEATAGISAIYLFVMGATMIAGQAVIAPQLHWGAAKLFRMGLLVLLIGVVLLWPVASHPLLVVSMLLIGVGSGLAMPGYNTGPTLGMSPEEQGAVAGTINANNGIAYAVAPVASTALYGWNQFAPFIASIAILSAVTIFAFVDPTLRKNND